MYGAKRSEQSFSNHVGIGSVAHCFSGVARMNCNVSSISSLCRTPYYHSADEWAAVVGLGRLPLPPWWCGYGREPRASRAVNPVAGAILLYVAGKWQPRWSATHAHTDTRTHKQRDRYSTRSYVSRLTDLPVELEIGRRRQCLLLDESVEMLSSRRGASASLSHGQAGKHNAVYYWISSSTWRKITLSIFADLNNVTHRRAGLGPSDTETRFIRRMDYDLSSFYNTIQNTSSAFRPVWTKAHYSVTN